MRKEGHKVHKWNSCRDNLHPLHLHVRFYHSNDLFPQDVDEFFQTERDHNIIVTGCTKNAAEVSPSFVCFLLSHKQIHTVLFDIFFKLFFLQRFLDVVLTEQSKKSVSLFLK